MKLGVDRDKVVGRLHVLRKQVNHKTESTYTEFCIKVYSSNMCSFTKCIKPAGVCQNSWRIGLQHQRTSL